MKLILITLFLVLFTILNLKAEDMNVSGDLNVTGNTDIRGNFLNFGAWNDDPLQPGFNLHYDDDGTGHLRFKINRAEASWTWMHSDINQNLVWAMHLSSDHSLLLYDQQGDEGLSLSPFGASLFYHPVNFYGNNQIMPNQTLTGDGSVLTRKLGDSRYILKGANNSTALGASTASKPFSTAMGGNSLANGDYSIAGGNSSIASGYASLAIGELNQSTAPGAIALGSQNKANNWFSAAIGYNNESSGECSVALNLMTKAQGMNSLAAGSETVASGYCSFSMGENSIASGDYSMAMGGDAQAIGPFSTAFGWQTKAQGYNQFVIGRYNTPTGNPNSPVATDDLFIIGAGESSEDTYNVFTVKNNGDMTVNGRTTFNSTTTFNSNLKVNSSFRIQPQGDLSMGVFNKGGFQ